MNTKQKLEKRRDSKWRKEIPQPSYYDQDRYEDYCLGFNALAESWLEMRETLKAISKRQSPAEMWCTPDETIELHWETLKQMRYEANKALTQADALLGGE
jgi:hypothetical protein